MRFVVDNLLLNDVKCRMLKVLSVLSLALVVGGCAGLDEPPQPEFVVRTQTIIGGQPESGYQAVGALVEGNEFFCTGTLVTSNVVVTAAHCLEGFSSASQLQFFFGNNANNVSSGSLVSVSDMLAHPQYDDYEVVNDIAVLRLSSSPNVQPIPFMTQSMESGFVGRETLLVGYGARDIQTEVAGERYSVWIPITEVASTTFTYSHASRNTCFGDSGGPALIEVNGQTRLIGVTSWGDDYCQEFGVNTRVDAYSDWIQGFADGNASGGDPGGTGGGSTGGNDGGGTSSDGDICEEEGWYNDGICDEDCANPDPDCEGNTGGGETGSSEDGDGSSNDWEAGCSMTGGAAGASWLLTMLPAAWVLIPRRRRLQR